jgi:gas vesicle protein
MTDADANDLIPIASDRLQQLEDLEKNLPDLIKQAIADYKKENLRKLHEKDKNNPEAVKNRVRKYISKNKDKINERRREKRKEKA